MEGYPNKPERLTGNQTQKAQKDAQVKDARLKRLTKATEKLTAKIEELLIQFFSNIPCSGNLTPIHLSNY
ncbi:uncharacterized protein L3040_001662 [Drepanopeziza brunnea f. sp. 'multigermtubi']|uniref:uncharacterized protein n=1 Tax=Drepanopeziza brunnea f. sp. 'multigermtubi' TaxID=698441 RepID=UPI002388372F|nr:hypothetical protein L3040_001662 [Drepanopeziza brunnea f. sp. 'multigermtubi']